MKYLKRFNEAVIGSPLLKLSNNVDIDMMKIIESKISSGNILEISCGNGSDAFYLKNKGYNVVCTELNPEYCQNSISHGVDCIEHDSKDQFPFENKQFDLVYSRLGIHYFEEEDLVNIFKEINRISNYLLFSVKLTDNVQTGKIIFTSDTWRNLVKTNFDMESSEIKEGDLYGVQSKWLEILAKSK